MKLCCSDTHFAGQLRCFEHLLLLDNIFAQDLMYSEIFLLGSVALLVRVFLSPDFCH